jgi:hypothetical protein
MSNKYQTKTGIRPPGICKKAPPWPAPTRLPRGQLMLTYEYFIWAWSGGKFQNTGMQVLRQTSETVWEDYLTDYPACVPHSVFTYDEDADTTQLYMLINLRSGLSVEFTSRLWPTPLEPPFIWSELINGEPEDQFKSAYCIARIEPCFGR